MTDTERQNILSKLNQLVDPKSGRGLVDVGLVQGLVAARGRAGFMLEVAPADVPLYEAVRTEAESLLAALPGVERAQVVLTASAEPSLAPSRAEPSFAARRAPSPAADARSPEQLASRALTGVKGAALR